MKILWVGDKNDFHHNCKHMVVPLFWSSFRLLFQLPTHDFMAWKTDMTWKYSWYTFPLTDESCRKMKSPGRTSNPFSWKDSKYALPRPFLQPIMVPQVKPMLLPLVWPSVFHTESLSFFWLTRRGGSPICNGSFGTSGIRITCVFLAVVVGEPAVGLRLSRCSMQ